MRNILFTLVLFTGFVFGKSVAEPILVSVELPAKADKQAWHKLDIPTYELIGNTAIAVIEPEQIPLLQQKGYRINIIDTKPDLADYLVCAGADKMPPIKGQTVWQNNNKAIIKTGDKNAVRGIFAHGIKPLNKTALSDKFWREATATYVFLTDISPDPFVQSLVDQVEIDTITAIIQRLQDFGTRLALTDSSYATSEWLAQKFNSWGYTAQLDSFWENGSAYYPGGFPGVGYERNVVATSPGLYTPATQYIVCGHFDATTMYDTITCKTNAPGADDNATGTAATMEIARIFSKYDWEPTIKYIGWAAEESYLLGSDHYAGEADSLGEKVGGVVNMDMMGYMNDDSMDCILGGQYDFSSWLSDLYLKAASIYAPGLALHPVNDWVSDDEPFSRRGYPAIGLLEYPHPWLGSNPNYHTINDVIGNLSSELYTRVTKAALATMTILGIHPGMVENVKAETINDGIDLKISWDPNPEGDVKGYCLYWGTNSGTYDRVFYSDGRTKAVDTLTGIYPGATYYLSVRAQDNDGHLSIKALELPVPLPRPNTILIVDNDGGALDKADNCWTKYIEASVANLGYRYSTITVDQYCSFQPGYLKAFPVVIWNMGPDFDTRVSSDYRVFSEGDNANLMEYLDTGGRLWMMGQSYLWRSNPDTISHPNLWRDYLHLAPNNGWLNMPCSILTGTTGDPIGDGYSDSLFSYYARLNGTSTYWTGVDRGCQLIADTTDTGAVGFAKDNIGGVIGLRYCDTLNGPYKLVYTAFPFEAVSTPEKRDTLACRIINWLMPETLDYTPPAAPTGLTAVLQDSQVMCSWLPNSEADLAGYKVYRALLDGQPQWNKIATVASPETSYADKSVKADSTYCFAVAAYDSSYPNNESARSEYVAVTIAVSGVSATGAILPFKKFDLGQNKPNPLTQSTIIRYQLAKAGLVSLKVYNIAGQLVRILDEGYRISGVHSIKWDGRDGNGHAVSNGIYIYRLQSGDVSQTRKMIVLR